MVKNSVMYFMDGPQVENNLMTFLNQSVYCSLVVNCFLDKFLVNVQYFVFKVCQLMKSIKQHLQYAVILH